MLDTSYISKIVKILNLNLPSSIISYIDYVVEDNEVNMVSDLNKELVDKTISNIIDDTNYDTSIIKDNINNMPDWGGGVSNISTKLMTKSVSPSSKIDDMTISNISKYLENNATPIGDIRLSNTQSVMDLGRMVVTKIMYMSNMFARSNRLTANFVMCGAGVIDSLSYSTSISFYNKTKFFNDSLKNYYGSINGLDVYFDPNIGSNTIIVNRLDNNSIGFSLCIYEDRYDIVKLGNFEYYKSEICV